MIVHIFMLHGSLFLIHKLLLLEYLYTPVALYSCSCYQITDKNPFDLLHVINIVNKLSYLHSGIPVISTVMSASSGTCAELSVTRSKVPHHTYTWWGSPLESVGVTSRILTPPVGWRGCLRCSCYKYCYWPDSIFLLSCIPVICTIMLASGTWCVELSATRNKMPHHRHGGGHLLNPWGPPLESSLCLVLGDDNVSGALVIDIIIDQT